MKCVFILIAILSSLKLAANLPDPVKEFERSSLLKYNKESFVNECPVANAEFKDQILVALDYYPELKNVHIQFRKKDLKTTMSSIPKWDFIFRKRENRIYRVNIDSKLKGEKGILLEDVPLNAQIGVIGHELGHVADYENKTAMGILLTGLGYLLPPFHKRLERKVDEITIAHGLGYQVEDFSDFVLNRSQASEKYKRFKRKYYYKPVQIAHLMSAYTIY